MNNQTTQRHEMKEFFTQKELAERFGLVEQTLRKWRKAGRGPSFVLVGVKKCLYRVEDVLAYEAKREVKQ